MKRARTININLRLPADLHKALVQAGASNSPPTSLNSEILSRLYESLERPALAALEKQVMGLETYALARIKDVEDALARVKEAGVRADQLTQTVEIKVAEFQERMRQAEAKLK